MAERNFTKFAEELRRSDAYWAERAKLDFAEDLGRLMDRRNINRSQLAERIGSSAAYITKVLRGDCNFTIESMVKLARALNGELSLHVSAAEDKVQWFEVLDFSGLQPCVPSGEVTAFRPSSKIKICLGRSTDKVSDGATAVAA